MSRFGDSALGGRAVVPGDAAHAGPTPMVDRRETLRYPAVSVEAWVAWTDPEDPTSIRTSPALMLDFSDRGAAVVVDTLPPPAGPTWLSLKPTALPDGMRARTVATTRTRIGPHLLRLSFVKPCSSETLSAVVDEPMADQG